MKISVIEINKMNYVPVKYVFELNKLDFNSAVLYFNSFKFDIERFYFTYQNTEYMCFKVSDFIKFIIIVSVLNKKTEKYVESIISVLEKGNFKVLNREDGDLIKVIDKYVRAAEPGEKPNFIMAKDLSKKMNNEDLSVLKNNQTIGRILKMKYKRVGKRIGHESRYGYEACFIDN